MNLPPFILDNPDAVMQLKHLFTIIDGISVKKVHEYTNQQVILHVAGHFLDKNCSKDDDKSCLHTVHNDII